MARATLQYFSRALGKASTVEVIFPEDPKLPRPWATFTLLHGLSDDQSIWGRRTSVERYVQDLPLLLIMPDGGRGWYSNALDGFAYEDDLLKDVLGLIERTFPVRAERAGRALGGLSMGGFGAIKLGLKHPDLFASVNSHSGAVGIARDRVRIEELGVEFKRIFGHDFKGGTDDPFQLAERVDRKQVPALRLDCGTADFLLAENRAFRDHLVTQQLPHEYEEFPGGHEWSYWDRHVQDAIAFHARNLGLKRL